MLESIGYAVAYTGVGIALLTLGFFALDLLTPGHLGRHIYENRSIVPVLQSTGMDVRYTEASDGHNWENWRDRLREGLSWLFPGPLLLVYE